MVKLDFLNIIYKDFLYGHQVFLRMLLKYHHFKVISCFQIII